MDNWEQIGAGVLAVLGIFGAIAAKLRVEKSERQKGDDADDALQSRRDKGSLEGTEQTIAGVFQLVAKLQAELDRKDSQFQAEITRKDQQLAGLEERCAFREKELENRIKVHEEAIARQSDIIGALRQEVFDLKRQPRE